MLFIFWKGVKKKKKKSQTSQIKTWNSSSNQLSAETQTFDLETCLWTGQTTPTVVSTLFTRVWSAKWRRQRWRRCLIYLVKYQPGDTRVNLHPCFPLISPDMEEHFGSLSRHTAGLLREGVFLQRRHAGILLRPRPRNVSAHPELLPHREAPLPATRVHPGLRRRAGLLRYRARDHWRLLHGGKTATFCWVWRKSVYSKWLFATKKELQLLFECLKVSESHVPGQCL